MSKPPKMTPEEWWPAPSSGRRSWWLVAGQQENGMDGEAVGFPTLWMAK